MAPVAMGASKVQTTVHTTHIFVVGREWGSHIATSNLRMMARRRRPSSRAPSLETDMSQAQPQYSEAEANYGTDLLNLMAA